MPRLALPLALAALLLTACSKGDAPPPVDPAPKPETPAAPAPPPAPAPAPTPDKAPEMEIGGDRPGELGCGECRVVVCEKAGAIAGLNLDTAKLQANGATIDGGKLTIKTGEGQAFGLNLPGTELGKADLGIETKLDGMPTDPKAKAWSAPSASLMVKYTTKGGEKGAIEMAVGKAEVGACP